jgi:hypothetical protein
MKSKSPVVRHNPEGGEWTTTTNSCSLRSINVARTVRDRPSPRLRPSTEIAGTPATSRWESSALATGRNLAGCSIRSELAARGRRRTSASRRGSDGRSHLLEGLEERESAQHQMAADAGLLRLPHSGNAGGHVVRRTSWSDKQARSEGKLQGRRLASGHGFAVRRCGFRTTGRARGP